MKFSNVLEERERNGPPRWAGQYISYKKLKKCLKQAKVDASATAAASSSVLGILEDEITRINSIVLNELDEIELTRRDIFRLRHLHPSAAQLYVSRERMNWKRAAELRDFVEIIYETVYKAIKKHDKVTGLALMAPVSLCLIKGSFMVLKWMPSLLNSVCRF